MMLLTTNLYFRPVAGGPVFITCSILLDQSPQYLFNTTIQDGGKLVWSPASPIHVPTNYISVAVTMKIGSEECPYEQQTMITLTEIRSKQDNVGQKYYNQRQCNFDQNIWTIQNQQEARLHYAPSQRRLKNYENLPIGSRGTNILQLDQQKLKSLLSETNTALNHLTPKLDVNHNSAQTETLRTEVSGLREENSGLQQQIETLRHTAVRPVEEEEEEEEEEEVEEEEEEEEAHTAQKTIPADYETDDSGVETEDDHPVAEGQAHSRESRQPRKTKLPSRKTDQRSSTGLKLSGEKLTTGQAIERVSPETPLLTLENKKAREKRRAPTHLFPATKQRKAPNSLESLSPTTSPIDRSVLTPDIRLQGHHQWLAEGEGDLHFQPRDVSDSDDSEDGKKKEGKKRKKKQEGKKEGEGLKTSSKDEPLSSDSNDSEDGKKKGGKKRKKKQEGKKEEKDEYALPKPFSTSHSREGLKTSSKDEPLSSDSNDSEDGKKKEGKKRKKKQEGKKEEKDEYALPKPFSTSHSREGLKTSSKDEPLSSDSNDSEDGKKKEGKKRKKKQEGKKEEKDEYALPKPFSTSHSREGLKTSSKDEPLSSDSNDSEDGKKKEGKKRKKKQEGKKEEKDEYALPKPFSTSHSREGLKTSSKDEPLSSDSNDSEDGKKKEGKKRKKKQEGKKEEKDEYALPKPFSTSHSREGLKTSSKDEPLSSDSNDSEDGKKKEGKKRKKKQEGKKEEKDEYALPKPFSTSHSREGLKTSSKDEPLSSDSDDSEDGKKKEGEKRKKKQEGKTEEKDEYALPTPFSTSHSREGPVGRVLHDDIWKRWEQSIDDSNLDGIQSLLKTGDLPDNELFGQLCDKEGLDSNIFKNVCDTLGRAMKTDSEQILCVWSGYIPDNEEQIVFVACTSVATRYAKPFVVYPLNTFSVIFRGANDFSSEAKDVLYSRESMDKMFTERERQNIRICIQENSKQLMHDHSNLTMISASPVRSVGFGTEISAKKPDTCIVIYLHVKGVIPLAEKLFPKLLKDSRGEVEFPVDVREGGYVNLSGEEARKPHSNLRIGCQIGSNWNSECKGTLGAFVDLPDGSLGCITCAHVLLSEDQLKILREKEMAEPTNLSVFQPAVLGEETPIGHVCKAIFREGGYGVTGVDVALVKLTDEKRHPITGCVPDGNHYHAGFTVESKMHFSSGEVISCEPTSERGALLIKFGRSSGITKGGFYLHGTSIRRQTINRTDLKFGIELHDQMECFSMGKTAFAKHGDSGALVLMVKGCDLQNLKAIGIVEGGTSTGTVLFTPIWDVLKALGLPNELKVFHHGSVFDRRSNAESTVEATAQCSPPLVCPSSSSQADMSKQFKCDDSGNCTIFQSVSPMDTSEGDMMAAVRVKPNKYINNSNNNSNSNSNSSDSDGLASVIAYVSRIDSELQSQKSETQALKKEISELRQDVKKVSEQQIMQHQEMMKFLQINFQK